jgi:hypothetical protein
LRTEPWFAWIFQTYVTLDAPLATFLHASSDLFATNGEFARLVAVQVACPRRVRSLGKCRFIAESLRCQAKPSSSPNPEKFSDLGKSPTKVPKTKCSGTQTANDAFGVPNSLGTVHPR